MSIRKRIIEDPEAISKIIEQAEVCYLSMIHKSKPYVIPMNFGYENGVFYLHSGPGGKKNEALQENPEVCIALNINSKLHVRHDHVACSYSMTYESIVAYGKLEFINDPQLKREYLNIIMKQYTGKTDFKYNDPAIDNVEVMKVQCNEITGHIRGL